MVAMREVAVIAMAKGVSSQEDSKEIVRARNRGEMINLRGMTSQGEIILLVAIGIGVHIPKIVRLCRGYILGTSN